MSNDIVSYDEAWAKDAKASAAAAKLTSGGRFISHRGGVFSVGEDLQFPELCAVILDSVLENTWYGRAYDPDNLEPPKCFALASDEASMRPDDATHESSWFEPQADACRACPRNEWPKKGEVRRKECRNARRVLLLPAGQYTPRKGSRDLDLDLFFGDDADENAEYVRQGDVFLMKLPPTALRTYKEIVNAVSAEHGRPPHGMIMRIYAESLRQGAHTVKFEPIGLVPSDLYPHIAARREAEHGLLLRPYTPPEIDAD